MLNCLETPQHRLDLQDAHPTQSKDGPPLLALCSLFAIIRLSEGKDANDIEIISGKQTKQLPQGS